MSSTKKAVIWSALLVMVLGIAASIYTAIHSGNLSSLSGIPLFGIFAFVFGRALFFPSTRKIK